MADYEIKQYSTGPSIEATLADSNAVAVSLAGATVRFHMADAFSGAIKISAPATIVDATTADVRYDWQAGDTDTAGWYKGEFRVVFSDGTVVTFPSDTYLDIVIEPALANP